MNSTASNADQIKYWNESSGAKWVAMQERLDEQLRPFGRAVMDHVPIPDDARVLDIGCGCGGTTLELARRASQGSVLGVDISAPMLARARERAMTEQVNNIRLLESDAQTHVFEPAEFDLAFSRFGVMFFDDPAAAFANIRRAMRPDGRLAFCCWQPLETNPWMEVPGKAVAPLVTMPPRPPPGTAGPFAFDDRARVRDILTRAGFRDIDIASHETKLSLGVGRSLDDTAAFAIQFGPAAVALREAPADVAPRAFEAVRAALAPFFVEGDGVVMPAAVWIVTARP